jgi:hypothetical protein
MPAIVIAALRNCIAELLEPQHRSDTLLDAAMVLLNQIIEIFRRPQLGLRRQRTIGLQLVHCSVRRGVAVQCDRLWLTLLTLDRFAEEGLGGSDIAPGAQPEVDCLTRPVHGTI